MPDDNKKKRYFYEAICDQQGCKAKGVMQEYQANKPRDTIICIFCKNEIVLNLVKINLVMFQDGIENITQGDE